MELKDMREVIDLTIKNGGHTVDIGGRYMVGLKEFEVVIPLKDITPIHLLDYFHHVKPTDDNVTLGTWLNDGMIYIDSSIAIDDLNQAMNKAKEHNQLAIFDTVELKEIYL